MFPDFLKMLGLLIQNVGRICFGSKPLQDPNTERKDHENPDSPSPADGFDNISADDRSENRPDERANQENCDTNNLLKSRVPDLQVKMRTLLRRTYIGNGASAEGSGWGTCNS